MSLLRAAPGIENRLRNEPALREYVELVLQQTLRGRNGKAAQIDIKIPADPERELAELKRRLAANEAPMRPEKAPMEEFWRMQGWIATDKRGRQVHKRPPWNDKQTRIDAIRFLVECVLQKDPKTVTYKDFIKNGLSGLMRNYYEGSPFKAISEAYWEYDIKAWEMPMAPKGLYGSAANRVSAIRWMVKKTGKDPRDITTTDFDKNGLSGLLLNYYNDSPYAAISEAYKGQRINPWEMRITPANFYNTAKHRVAAIKWLAKQTGKDPRDLVDNDFKAHRLGGLLAGHYHDSPYAAVTEAYPEQRIKPWEMHFTPTGFFNSADNKATAVRWLVETHVSGGDPRDLTQAHFEQHRLSGLLRQFDGSPYLAVAAAYPDAGIRPWEMVVTPKGYFKEREKRLEAINWLTDKLHDIPARELTKTDFRRNRLSGLLGYYHGSVYEALLDAGKVTAEDELFMRVISPRSKLLSGLKRGETG